jgi:acetyltransferase-like isoleucine patch superfamily enzyme
MNAFLKVARPCRQLIRRIRRFNKIVALRLRGVEVDWSADVYPDAILERSGGRISIGAGSYIDKGVIIRPVGGSIVIGSGCSVNAYSFLVGAGDITIGDAVRIGSHVRIIASNHVFSDPDVLIKDQGETKVGIQIEDDVWIGTGVCVLDGVRISRGCVLAAGTIVTRSTEAYSVVAGVPGKKISSRKR